MEWATLPLKKYADFSGRARRKEYWMFTLLMIVAYVVAMVVDGVVGIGGVGPYGLVTLLVLLAFLLPSLAVTVRRLHDTNRSGWWFLIVFVPIVGGIVLLVFIVLEGTRGPNEYGPDPKEGEGGAQRAAI
jgi:uncharacterized membrane protein YhaH (DUF805 family)